MTRAWIVGGLGFGDEGKGSVVDYLTRREEAHLVVRYSGGAQAGHNVVTPEGLHHCFSQWGSGTFAGAYTYLSKYMIVNPIFMLAEGKHLVELGITDAWERVTIDQNALITTPFHVSINRLQEIHREFKAESGINGSCGMGIGATVEDAYWHPAGAIRMRDLLDLGTLREKATNIQEQKIQIARELTKDLPRDSRMNLELSIISDPKMVDRFIHECNELLSLGVKVGYSYKNSPDFGKSVIFEGAQGILLDEEWGFHPYTTWSNCTFDNALQILRKESSVKVTKMGVIRAYHTRHGAGPFPTEDKEAKIRDHNVDSNWQGRFRVGFFDFVLARYARDVLGSIDEVAINHLDQVHGPQKVCNAHNFQGGDLHRYRGRFDHDMYLEFKKMDEEEGFPYSPIQLHVMSIYTTLPGVDRLISGISKTMRAPVTIRSYGPTANDKRETR